MLAVFMVGIDDTVLDVALPSLVRELAASQASCSVLLAGFVVWEAHSTHPMLDLRCFHPSSARPLAGLSFLGRRPKRH